MTCPNCLKPVVFAAEHVRVYSAGPIHHAVCAMYSCQESLESNSGEADAVLARATVIYTKSVRVDPFTIDGDRVTVRLPDGDLVVDGFRSVTYKGEPVV